MKVVLFCGGMGTRLREHSETIPKPLVNIGYRPIIWHLMRYYAHFGHKDFVLCLGYRGDLIKQFFLNYDECTSNDFVLSEGGRKVEPLKKDMEDWRITFVETGMHSNIGERLMAVRQHLEGEEMFLANYADGLAAAPLDQYIDAFSRLDCDAGMLAVRSPQSFHVLQSNRDGMVNAIEPISQHDLWFNAGFFVLRQAIFDWIRPGDELVEAPFKRLIEARRLYSFRYDGFWAAMDTLKDKISFDRRYARGDAPWEVWRNAGSSSSAA